MPEKRLLGFATLAPVIFLSILQVSALVTSPLIIRSSGTIESGLFFVVALDGSGDFSNIQRAIDAVPEGEYGDILVKQGTYVLNPVQKWLPNYIVAKPRIRLHGEGIDKTIVVMSPPEVALGVRHDVITTEADVFDFTLQDLTVNQNAPEPDNAGSSVVSFRGGSSRNVLIQRVKVINGFGAGIGIQLFENVTIRDCQISNCWTGINLLGGQHGLVKGNTIVDITGNGIFPQVRRPDNTVVTDVIIEDNYLENVGDIGIGIAGVGGLPPHERFIVRRNTMKGAGIGVTGGKDIYITENIIETTRDLPIYADQAQGMSTNITVVNNKIRTHAEVGIGFYSVQDCSAINNTVTMLTPNAGVKQIGILPVIRGTGLIEENTIIGSANYGIDFKGWSISSTTMTIRGNTILDFGDIGIYDSAVGQGPVLVENNIIWDRQTPFVSRYGIRTDYAANEWTIRYNRVYAGSIAYISAPSSSVYGNIYEPPG